VFQPRFLAVAAIAVSDEHAHNRDDDFQQFLRTDQHAEIQRNWIQSGEGPDSPAHESGIPRQEGLSPFGQSAQKERVPSPGRLFGLRREAQRHAALGAGFAGALKSGDATAPCHRSPNGSGPMWAIEEAPGLA